MGNWSTKRGQGKGIKFLIDHMADVDGPCVIWPFFTDCHGYGVLGHNGKVCKAHKKMCELVNGPRPTPKHQASHSCGNGDGGCIHPCHLSWKTASENQLDRRGHGTAATSRWGNKGRVTVEIALQVFKMRGVKSQLEIKRLTGLSTPTIRNIYKGKSRAAKAAIKLLAA